MFRPSTSFLKSLFSLVLYQSLVIAFEESQQASIESSPHRNFAIVVDIGSTGSRAHVFEYTYDKDGCKGQGKVRLSLPERVSKIRPGLSTFLETAVQDSSSPSANKRRLISEYLDRIRMKMDSMVVRKRRSKTPVWLFGTGGMRHYSTTELNEILNMMREIVSNEWTQYITHPDWIGALDGEREGLFSWFFLNQLLGRSLHPDCQEVFIEPPPHSELNGQSVALVELGGASAQVVVQLSSEIASQMIPKLPKAPHVNVGPVHPVPDHPGFSTLNFCNTSLVVFARSFQGFGRQLAFQRFLAAQPNSSPLLPCLVPDVVYPMSDLESLVANEDIGVVDDGKAVGYRGVLNGTFELCNRAVDDAIFGPAGNYTAEESQLPFQIDNDVAIVGTENFYHFHKMVANPASEPPHKFSINSLRERAQELCKVENVSDIFSRLHRKAEFEKAKTACFGLTYLASLLKKVLRLDDDREIEGLNKVNNVDVSWAAGHILLELPHLIRQYDDLVPSSGSANSQSRDEL